MSNLATYYRVTWQCYEGGMVNRDTVKTDDLVRWVAAQRGLFIDFRILNVTNA